MNVPARTMSTVLAVLALLYVGISPASSARAQGGQGTVDAHAVISQATIGCGESVDVAINLQGETTSVGLVTRPVDVMLIFDRSGSMERAMPALKTAAHFFVDIVDSATDGVQDGVIGVGTRVGVVSFAGDAFLDESLTIDAARIKDSIDALRANGNTNPRPAFRAAQQELLGSLPGNLKMIVIFTDGRPEPTNLEIPATLAAHEALDAGIEIYTVGLGAVVIGTITQWASDPAREHVYVTPSADELFEIYDDISTAFARSAASVITVTAAVDPRFTASDVRAPRGTVVQSGQDLVWTVFQLRTEEITLRYRLTHNGSPQLGRVPVHATATYSDAEGRVFGLEDLSVDVNFCSPLRERPGSPATVVQLTGTPHLWLTDDRGVLHWGGDTRSLAGRSIDWPRRQTMTLAEITALPTNEPLLSNGIVDFEGALYLVKWETEETAPRLLHIRNLADARGFGVTPENLAALMIDPGVLEGRLGRPLSSLERGVLVSPGQ